MYPYPLSPFCLYPGQYPVEVVGGLRFWNYGCLTVYECMGKVPLFEAAIASRCLEPPLDVGKVLHSTALRVQSWLRAQIPAIEDKSGGEIDWNGIFWGLQSLNDPRFSREMFWRCPVDLVSQGLRYSRCNERWASRQRAMAIAATYRAAGVKNIDESMFDLPDIGGQTAGQRPSEASIAVYRGLRSRGMVPMWIAELPNFKEL